MQKNKSKGKRIISSVNKNLNINLKHSKSEKKESQAALDYLMSWGWVLIIIVLVLVILFSLGIFHIPSAPTIISGFKGITMQAAEANSTMMVVKITNNYNQFINITGVTVNVAGNSYTSYSCLDTIISTGQSTLCRVPVSIKTSSYLSNVQISFTPYKSRIYEVSNGTVSSTLVSGAIPINNQLTYFIEKGLPYGSTFTVTYNTSTNSTTVSPTAQNVSFDLPFGDYQFSVPEVIYQGCSSIPSPTSGVHSTGVEQIIQFTSNCTTTFSETGLPSGQTWQVSYNGSTASNSTGNSIKIETNNTKNTQLSYTAVAKSDNLACVSYKTPSIRLGGNYTFSAWNCTTTFGETGLPTAASYNQWQVSYPADPSASTGNEISVLQTDITTVSFLPANGSSTSLVCGQLHSVEQGSTYTFGWWICNTTVLNTGVTNYPTSWNVSFSGFSADNLNVGESPLFSQNLTSVSPLSYSTNINGYSCLSSGSAYPGSKFNPAWTCTTTFTESGLQNGLTWNVTYDGITYSSKKSSISFDTTLGTYNFKVIPTLSNTVISNITVGFAPYAVAYDSANGDIYVANAVSNTTSVINSSSNTVISSISVGDDPEGIAYDSANGDIYVANEGSNTVSVISSSSNAVISSITVGSAPDAVAYDSVNGDIYVANYDSNTVSVISSSSNTVISSISVGDNPEGIAYDSANGDIYVANLGSNSVSMLTPILLNISSGSLLAGSTENIKFYYP